MAASDQRHLEEHPDVTRRLARQLVADVGVMSVSAWPAVKGSVGIR